MELDEIKERYKSVPILGRLLCIAALAVLPALYTWWDEGTVLEETLVDSQSKEDAARVTFEKNRKMKGNLPELEAKLEFTEVQLGKARKKLPDSYRIEDVLQKAATIAKETGVKLKLFKPGKEARSGVEYKYFELPITTEISGKFSQVASFFDRVVHLEGTIFLRNIAVQTRASELNEDTGAVRRDKNAAAARELSDYEKARRARTELTVDGRFEIVIFRGMSEREQALAENDVPGGAGVPGVPGGDVPVPAPPAGRPPRPEGADDGIPKPKAGDESAANTIIGGAAERRF